LQVETPLVLLSEAEIKNTEFGEVKGIKCSIDKNAFFVNL
jgi:hypothetical protein